MPRLQAVALLLALSGCIGNSVPVYVEPEFCADSVREAADLLLEHGVMLHVQEHDRPVAKVAREPRGGVAVKCRGNLPWHGADGDTTRFGRRKYMVRIADDNAWLAVHEFGHVFGLEHTGPGGNVMAAPAGEVFTDGQVAKLREGAARW